MRMVDLTPLALMVLAAVCGVIGRVGLAIIRAKVKNQEMRELLEVAFGNSLGKIQQASAQQIVSAAALHPMVDPRLAVGVQYVADHAGEALDHFGISEESVADKIEARIGVASIATNLAITANATTAIAAPLAPVAPTPAPAPAS